MQYVEWFYKLKEEIHATHGINIIEDLKHFAFLINECSKRGYNTEEILLELTQLYLASTKIMVLHGKIKELLDKVKELEAKQTATESNIEYFENRHSEYIKRMPILDHLENIGFGYDQLIGLTKIIERISIREKISLMEAANKFLNEIEQQYFKRYQNYV